MISESRKSYYRRLVDKTSGERREIAVLVGGPGWGKTRSLLEVESLLSERDNTLPIYLPLDTLCFSPEFFINHAVRLIDQHVRAKTSTLGDTLADQGLNTVIEVFQAIRNMASKEGFRLVFLLDEISDLSILKSFPGNGEVVDDFYEFIAGGNFSVLATTAFPGKIIPIEKQEQKSIDYSEIPLLDVNEIALIAESKGLSANSSRLIHKFTGRVPGYAVIILDHLVNTGRFEIVDELVTLMKPDSALELKCRYNYEYLVQRSRGEGIVRHLLSALASMDNPTLTQIAQILGRSLGVTKDYLKWLLAVGLIDVKEKRYSLRDGLLSLWIQLYQSGQWPTEEMIRQKVGTKIRDVDLSQKAVKSEKPLVRKKLRPASPQRELEESPEIILPRKKDIDIEELD